MTNPILPTSHETLKSLNADLKDLAVALKQIKAAQKAAKQLKNQKFLLVADRFEARYQIRKSLEKALAVLLERSVAFGCGGDYEEEAICLADQMLAKPFAEDSKAN